MKTLGEYIKVNKCLERIDLQYNKINDAGIETLAPYLEGNITLKMLEISGMQGITEVSVPLFLRIIETSHIQDIIFAFTLISEVKALTAPLAINQIKYGTSSILSLSAK